MRDAKHAMPHKSTLSRWRLLVDGCFMMVERQRNASTNTSKVRYLMADSSTQHGRDFEHVTALSIDGTDIVEAYENANALVNFWSLRESCRVLRVCSTLATICVHVVRRGFGQLLHFVS